MKKSLFFGCAVLAALIMFTACGDKGDPTSPPATPDTPSPTPPAPITAKSFDLTVTTGDTAFKVVATGGTLASGLKVYIADDGTAVVITKAGSVEDYTEASNVSRNGQVIVVTGLTVGSGSSGTDTLDSDAEIPVTLAVDAQTAAVSSITGLSKVPFVFPDSTYTLKTTAASNTQDDVYYAGGQLRIGNTNSDGTDDYSIDPDIDSDVGAYLDTLVSLLVEDDLVTINGGQPSAIELATAPTGIAAFNTILGLGIPTVTLADNFVIAVNGVLTIPEGVELILDDAGITLTNDAENPARIVFAGAGATLSAGGSESGTLSQAAGVFAADNSTTQDVIPVSSFTELTITGGNDDLASIVYVGGTDPWISGPKTAEGSGVVLDEDTDCTT
jgi:predicted small lipoprotein YifL